MWTSYCVPRGRLIIRINYSSKILIFIKKYLENNFKLDQDKETTLLKECAVHLIQLDGILAMLMRKSAIKFQ